MKPAFLKHFFKYPFFSKISLSFIPIFLLLSIVLTSCETPSLNRAGDETQLSPTPMPEKTATPEESPHQTHNPLPQSSGPFLLIQSDFTEFKFLDIATGNTTSFIPPGNVIPENLGSNLSPDGSKMLFLSEEREIYISNIISGELFGSYFPDNENITLKPDITLQKIHDIYTDLEYSDDVILDLINKTYQESTKDIRWHQDDKHFLLPQIGNATSTNLSLFDTQNGSVIKLESQPGMVLDYASAPDGEKILLKKGYIDEPGFWQDNRYYILDIQNKSIQPILLPELIDNPILFWLNNETIGLIHRMQPIGGDGFSTFDINKNTFTQIIKGPFSHLRKYDEDLLVINEDQTSKNTTLSLLTFQGETIHQQTLKNRCLFKTKIGALILLNCEAESLIIDNALKITPFGDLVSLLAQAPGKEIAVLVTQDGEVYQINLNTLARDPIILEDTPLEIRWLPDGSGFLYRTSGKLYIYDLNKKDSRMLIESQNLGDYTNINAVWISVN